MSLSSALLAAGRRDAFKPCLGESARNKDFLSVVSKLGDGLTNVIEGAMAGGLR